MSRNNISKQFRYANTQWHTHKTYCGIMAYNHSKVAIHHCHAEVHVSYARIAATARAIGNTRALNERRLLMHAVAEELVVFHTFESTTDTSTLGCAWHTSGMHARVDVAYVAMCVRIAATKCASSAMHKTALKQKRMVGRWSLENVRCVSSSWHCESTRVESWGS